MVTSVPRPQSHNGSHRTVDLSEGKRFVTDQRGPKLRGQATAAAETVPSPSRRTSSTSDSCH